MDWHAQAVHKRLSVYSAQVDNLRTNHRGTFVLKDQSFRWLAKLSVDPVPPSSMPQNGSLHMHPAAGLTPGPLPSLTQCEHAHCNCQSCQACRTKRCLWAELLTRGSIGGETPGPREIMVLCAQQA